MAEGIPQAVRFAVVPNRAVEVVLCEPKLLGAHVSKGGGDAIVGDKCFELATEVVALNLCQHKCPKGDIEINTWNQFIMYPPYDAPAATALLQLTLRREDIPSVDVSDVCE